MRTLTVIVPGRPPGVNDTDRMVHWQRRKVRQEWKDTTVVEARFAIERWSAQGESWEPLEHCSIAVTWHCKVRRNRDFDNLVSGLKPVLDGLVTAGVMVDDHTGCVTMLGPLRVEVGTERDETILTIRETNNYMEWRMEGEG